MNINLLPPVMGGIGLIAAFVLYALVKRYPAGEGAVEEIAEAIHQGAMTFIRREYTLLWGFAAVVAVVIFLSPLGLNTTIAFVTGALSSSIAGGVGMYTATRANVRTATAANTEGAGAALSVAFYGGSIMGLTVAAMGLLGLGSLYILFGSD
ncbi:MAG: sodium/proton-translocating pyrophosphatase, partial [Pseudomonadota bacterium]